MAHFGLRKYRLLGSDSDVSRKRQPRARTECPSVNRTDNRLSELPQSNEVPVLRSPRIDQLCGTRIRWDSVGPSQIATPTAAGSLMHPGRKRPSCAGNHYG